MLLLHRLRWIASACYWSARHLSIGRGCWVAAFECGPWPRHPSKETS